MKVGDVVRQRGGFVKGNLKTDTRSLGVVIKITDTFPEEWPKTDRRQSWAKMLGRGITVLWSNGKIHENFAENALVVVSDISLENDELEWLNTAATQDRIEEELKPIDASIMSQEDEYDEEMELYKTYGGD